MDALDLFFARLIKDTRFLALIISSSPKKDLELFGQRLLEIATSEQNNLALCMITQRVKATESSLAIAKRLYQEGLDEHGTAWRILSGQRTVVFATLWS